MEIQLWFLNIIILLGLIMALAFLLLKTIIYHNEIKLAQLETQNRSIQLAKDEAKMKLEKSEKELENTQLLIQYAQFMKNNGQEVPPGYHSTVEETFKEVEKQK